MKPAVYNARAWGKVRREAAQEGRIIRPGAKLNEFETREAMLEAARAFCVERLAAAIARRGGALFLVSGGSTPLPLYEALSEADIDWSKATIALVDERWVPLDDGASNERAVRARLHRNRAAAARFIGLKTDHACAADAVEAVEERLAAAPWPADVAVLGMGADGHTASWFPNAHGLDAAIDSDTARRCAAVTAHVSPITGAHVERMTLTAPAILQAGAQLVLMTGEEKKLAFARARASGPVDDMPVRALFLGDPDRLYPCWVP
ncbi:6-phosphogluconolactonase [Amphiplicatus metriothermophilus]|uniref:6-phosphogluconolactonase n=1 Tax=Amphiplicatus metriothermophilus TaxID=1519374 RepID=UPI0013574459|nr:6-phosphogluconolactonase [Amphiplicatus metriothermophilus]MBB5519762.1 6-phosphogluconolactonase [Amphiplicatus metriothermophilus]